MNGCKSVPAEDAADEWLRSICLANYNKRPMRLLAVDTKTARLLLHICTQLLHIAGRCVAS